MTLLEALSLTKKVRRPHWRRHIYWLFPDSNDIVYVPGTEISHKHMSIEAALATDWEPCTAEDNVQELPNKIIMAA